LVACPAGNGRFHGDDVSPFKLCHGRADGFDDRRAFMAQADGIAEVEVSDARRREVVEITAADPDELCPEEDVVVMPDFGCRDIVELVNSAAFILGTLYRALYRRA